jgi:pyruvate dehydrogenase E2 component (dihydrolipoamide acetyltransferase)
MDFRLPRLGEGAESGTVVTILVSVGDRVAKDQTILELENEKATAPIPSPAAGVIDKIHVKQGDEVTVGQLLFSLTEAGGSGEAERPEAKAPTQTESPPQRAVENKSEEPYRYQSAAGLPPPAPPSIRKMARDLGIDLTRVKGSERGGRITLADIRAYIERLQESALKGGPAQAEASRRPQETVDFSKWGPVSREKMSSLRRTVAERTTQSWSTVPHVTQFEEADITSLADLREKYVAAYEKKGARLTLTAMILKALIPALKKHRIFNASLDEASQEIVYKDYYHLGVAVDTEAGLIVPVIKDVDKKDVGEISRELAAMAEKTRQRKISAEELQGGTFTVSNLGGIGGAHFTPIINKPQAAILGLGKGTLKPAAKDGKIELRRMLPLAVSYDHRLIDGAAGARFVREIAQALESYPEEELKIKG